MVKKKTEFDHGRLVVLVQFTFTISIYIHAHSPLQNT